MQKSIDNLLKSKLRVIPNFPKSGINFRDVTSWFEDADCLAELRSRLITEYVFRGVTKVVGVESRGFIGASILAEHLHAGLVLARKPGKLPTKTESISYHKEYGTDSIEIAEGSIKEGDVVIIHDDLLATGGTAMAVYKLVKRFKPAKVYFSFLTEIIDEGCEGRKLLESLNEEINVVLKT